MLTLLDTVSHILGYFNINNKPLNMAWTIAAFLGDGYLAYITFLAFRNGLYARGAIYLALVLVFLYFIYLNFMYYFTKKTAKFDISPKIAKLLPSEEQTAERRHNTAVLGNGLFDPNETLPAHISATPDEQAFFQQLMTTLGQDNVLPQLPINAAGHRSLPYFTLSYTPTGELQVIAGTNQLTAQPIGKIDRVGFGNVNDLADQYDFALAELAIPEAKKDHPDQVDLPELIVSVAYQPKPKTMSREKHKH
ncbi:MAG: DUF6681 family protein [Schleiferilactobacillus harbinensis]